MSWVTTKLGDVLTLKRGYDLPSSIRELGDVPVVSSSGVTGQHNVAKVNGPGVVTGRYGTLGEVFFIDKDFWPLNTSLYVQHFKGNVPRFIAYFLRQVLSQLSSDKAAVPGVNRNDLHAKTVRLPDPKTQERIADTLGTYDDLIENNRRRMQLLEQAARLLYKEWFVHLRFPGHEHVKIKDGVPEGWERVPLSHMCMDVRQQVDPSKIDPKTPYVGLEHIPRRSITLQEWGKASDVESSKFAFNSGDVLFGKIRPYFHKVVFAITDGITSSDAIVIRPNENWLYEYVLFLISSDLFVALASKTVREGSKMPRADWKFLSSYLFELPPQEIVFAFADTTSGIIAQLKVLALQNRQLAKARDLLLPRLMNGEIAV